MSYHRNPYLGSSEAPPAKRRRGRPRKDQNAVAEKPCPSPSILTRSTTSVDTQRVASASHLLQPIVPTTTTDKGKGSVMTGFSPASAAAVDTNNNDDLVGQVVTGRVDGSFDAGLFLSVKVGAGENEKYLRGVVFQPGKFVPVTPQNDIAPLAKMHTRMDFPVLVNHAHEFKTTPPPPQAEGGGSSQHANSSVAVAVPAAVSVVDNVADDHQVVASESNNDKALQPPTDVLEKRDLEASIAIQLLQNRAPCRAPGSGSSTALKVESANHHHHHHHQPALVQVDTTGSGTGYQVTIAADQPDNNNDTNTNNDNDNDNDSLLSYQQDQQTEPSFAIEMENNDDRKIPSEVLVVNLEPPAAGQVAQLEESTMVVDEQFNSDTTSEKKEKDILVTIQPKEDDGDSTFDKPKQLTDKCKGTSTTSSLALEIPVGDKQALEILVMDSDPNNTSSNNDLANPFISQSAQDQEEAPPAEMEVNHLEKEPSLVAPHNEKKITPENKDEDTPTATVFPLIPDAREILKEKENNEEYSCIPFVHPFPVLDNGIEISSPQLNTSGDSVNPEVGSIPNPIVSDSVAVTDKGVSEETTKQSACSHTQEEPILPEQDQANSDAQKDHLHLTNEGAVSQSGDTSIAVESSIAVEKEEGCGHEQVSNDVVSETKPMDHEE